MTDELHEARLKWVLEATNATLAAHGYEDCVVKGSNWNLYKQELEVAVEFGECEGTLILTLPKGIIDAGKTVVQRYVLSTLILENLVSPASNPVPDDTNEGVYERSGRFTTSCRLTAFLYGLMRDFATAGTVERLMEETPRKDYYQLTNGWLAAHAEDVAKRLLPREAGEN